MSSPEAPVADLIPAVTDLLRQAGLTDPRFEFIPLSGGANNQVYRLELPGRAPLVLKRYFFSPQDRRDRFHSEKSFYDFLRAAGLRTQTPQALVWDREGRLGLFSWIDGRRLGADEVSRSFVDQALAFYFSLNIRRHLPEAGEAPNASEACFDLAQHFECVERRLARLSGMTINTPLDQEAFAFVSESLKPAFSVHQQNLDRASAAEKAVLEPNERCFSPSDFGFHNALCQGDGTLAFFDFEYAGWDDPAKFLCDFLCQPAVSVPRSLWPHCIESLCGPQSGATNRERIALLLPIYHIKWCCILLNEFLPRERDRRAFSGKFPPHEIEAKKGEQLDKARRLFESLAGIDLPRNLGFDDPSPASA